MLAALAADRARYLRRVGVVRKVFPAGSRHGGASKLLRPVMIGPGVPPHLIGSRAEGRPARRETAVSLDRVKELLPYAKLRPSHLTVWLTELGFSGGQGSHMAEEIIVEVFPCTYDEDLGGEWTVPAGSRACSRSVGVRRIKVW